MDLEVAQDMTGLVTYVAMGVSVRPPRYWEELEITFHATDGPHEDAVVVWLTGKNLRMKANFSLEEKEDLRRSHG